MTTLGQIGRQPPANADIAKIINNLTKNSPTQNWMIHKKQAKKIPQFLLRDF
ncbi:hypothetical protein [Comamonas denitrificans]|uniref:hypothetical protein n=1 Tax=Comamonas denitrificans TaxID=117506 RepID=UPI0031017E7F